ncbi:MAG: metal-dependent hydrolase [Anaerolineae bacterium]|nr:metal-dependent hydrolase [Anaerolineae bacterium]
MKGIAHFASGLCVAAWLPGVVQDAAQGGLLIALGGACAMLPDTLDFRIERFIEHRHANIAPSAEQPNAPAFADALAATMRAALADGKPRIAQLHPTRRGVVNWVLYSLRFDVANGDVVVRLADHVHDAKPRIGRAHVGPLDYGYDGEIHIEELGGPSLKFVPVPSRADTTTQTPAPTTLRIDFLPWHRQRTHSLLLAAGLGVLVGGLLGWTAGLVAGLGYAVHVLEDQLGYMGSNLWWPLTSERTAGLKWLHASDAPANAATVWLSLSLLLLVLDRARDAPLLPLLPYLLLVVGLPSLLLIGLQARRAWRRHHPTATDEGDFLADVGEGRT